jgi:cytochrome P450
VVPDPQEAPGDRRAESPLGAAVTIAELTADPHPVLRRLRAAEPVSWLPALGGWLVTRYDLAEQVLRDPRSFTVDDPKFTTARVVGTSMLSLDGVPHRRHRDPFAAALRSADIKSRLAEVASGQAALLVGQFAGRDRAELRRGLAGPLSVTVMAEMLGLDAGPAQLLAWYDAIVAAVSALAVADGAGGAGPVDDPGEVRERAAAAYAELTAHVAAALAPGRRPSVLTAAAGLTVAEVVSNAAVLLFGGIETTEGMICNVTWYLLADPAALGRVAADRAMLGNAIEESLRLEPAAAVVDRYATANVALGGAAIRRRDLVTVSLAGANRDPRLFSDPDRFDPGRANARQHLSFALGPHFCLGAHLARMEATAALEALLDRLPGLRLDPDQPSAPQGLVFRKPPALHVRWDQEDRDQEHRDQEDRA